MNVHPSLRLRFLIVLMVFSVGQISAHPGGYAQKWQGRIWRLNGRSVDASFVVLHGNTVLLRQRDGGLVTVDRSVLGGMDAEYVTKRIEFIRQLNSGRVIGEHNAPGTFDLSHMEATGRQSYLLSAVVPTINWFWYAVWLSVVLVLVGMMYRVSSYRQNRLTEVRRMILAIGLSVFALSGIAGGIPPLPFVVAATDPITIDSTFAPFKPRVATSWDSIYFYVESNGMPTQFPPMVGITAWQQQVPIPQVYADTNAWSIPLKPVFAATPLSTDNALFTGAIGVAVNGIPIFNAKNNRGEDSYAIGELDEWGGHCGRADDYHYHIAPLHLRSIVGGTRPIAWALDGFPVYGDLEPDGLAMKPLDSGHGHVWNGSYHYHGTMTYPYMIGALRGEVRVENDQIVPQPRTKGVRPATSPLKGAVITGFVQCGRNHYALKYKINDHSFWVIYQWDSLANYTYTFVDSTGASKVETYKRR